ncbi:hypothetical protein FocTR4_00005882 [Fusarium oxysporum f. sp. cubense]|uniref:Stress-response A/B barrel domain-containing protein n=1 Tax=Fusarium oxysporum f. sp. cubense TaxID=61366 RepID=A0A5C6TER6_FUSOC|nr:hypothetical protein FocTR4_00005882 [Fusarium oxysporum f. sp. cubense]
MTVIHIVLFKFRADVDESHRKTFVKELKALKTLPCVKDERLVVGEQKLMSSRVTSQYLWPFAEDVTRFDFEVAEEDEDTFEKSFNLSSQ